jgi:KaiC/GvpD/RAD55 family RecA-like ATPase
VEGARTFNESGVLVVMEETPSRIIWDMWRLGWDIKKVVSMNKIRIIYANPFTYTKFVETIKDISGSKIASRKNISDIFEQIQVEVEAIRAKMIFIDSITSLKLSPDPTEVRHKISEFVKNLEFLDCTILISSEMKAEQAFNVEEYPSSSDQAPCIQGRGMQDKGDRNIKDERLQA